MKGRHLREETKTGETLNGTPLLLHSREADKLPDFFWSTSRHPDLARRPDRLVNSPEQPIHFTEDHARPLGQFTTVAYPLHRYTSPDCSVNASGHLACSARHSTGSGVTRRWRERPVCMTKTGDLRPIPAPRPTYGLPALRIKVTSLAEAIDAGRRLLAVAD